MKILIVCTLDFWNQEHLWIAKDAYSSLKKNNHTVDLIRLPFNNDCLSYFEQVLAYRSLDLNLADLIITFGPFSHVIEHRKKIAFITNHLKGFYELWDSPYGELATEANSVLKEKISYLDLMALSESKKNFCFYEKIKKRYPSIVVDVLPIPKVAKIPLVKKDNRKTIVSLGNFDSDYRFDLLVKSLSFVETSDFKLVIAGHRKRIDIYDAVQKSAKRWVAAGVLELVCLQNSNADHQILSQADLFLDCGIESDLLSASIYKGLQFQKPVSGIRGCGFFEKTLFGQNSDFIFPEEPKELGKYLNQFLEKSSSIDLSGYYVDYDKAKTIDWEQVIS